MELVNKGHQAFLDNLLNRPSTVEGIAVGDKPFTLDTVEFIEKHSMIYILEKLVGKKLMVLIPQPDTEYALEKKLIRFVEIKELISYLGTHVEYQVIENQTLVRMQFPLPIINDLLEKGKSDFLTIKVSMT